MKGFISGRWEMGRMISTAGIRAKTFVVGPRESELSQHWAEGYL